MERNASREQSAYAAAGSIAEEVFGAIRTVVSFGGEHHEGARWDIIFPYSNNYVLIFY